MLHNETPLLLNNCQRVMCAPGFVVIAEAMIVTGAHTCWFCTGEITVIATLPEVGGGGGFGVGVGVGVGVGGGGGVPDPVTVKVILFDTWATVPLSFSTVTVRVPAFATSAA